MTDDQAILVVGGYGMVGRRIAARLAPRYPGRVIIAGRDENKASALSRELGHGARARRVDTDDPTSIEDALRGVGTVMMCVAQREFHFMKAVLAHGLAYTDTAPRLAFWRGAEALDAEAKRTGARIVLGTGLSPGVSNMMAAKLAALAGGVDRIETAIFLGLGDEYGPDSLYHVLEAVTQRFTVRQGGRDRQAAPFTEGQPVAFPAPIGERTAYVFPWSDVVYYPQTLGAGTAVGRFALDPPWLGAFASALVRTGAARLLARPRVSQGHRRAIEQIKRLFAGRDHFGLVVTVGRGERELEMSLAGRHQADVTACGASEFVHALVNGAVSKAGVWLPEQVVPHEPFFAALTQAGWSTTVHDSHPEAQSSFRLRHA